MHIRKPFCPRKTPISPAKRRISIEYFTMTTNKSRKHACTFICHIIAVYVTKEKNMLVDIHFCSLVSVDKYAYTFMFHIAFACLTKDDNRM